MLPFICPPIYSRHNQLHVHLTIMILTSVPWLTKLTSITNPFYTQLPLFLLLMIMCLIPILPTRHHNHFLHPSQMIYFTILNIYNTMHIFILIFLFQHCKGMKYLYMSHLSFSQLVTHDCPINDSVMYTYLQHLSYSIPYIKFLVTFFFKTLTNKDGAKLLVVIFQWSVILTPLGLLINLHCNTQPF